MACDGNVAALTVRDFAGEPTTAEERRGLAALDPATEDRVRELVRKAAA